MPPRDPTLVQADFPQLTADLIRELQLVGTIGLMTFIPSIQPTFIVGSRGLTITNEPPPYLSSEIFDAEVVDPGSNVVIVDTGELDAGNFDIILSWEMTQTAAGAEAASMQLRNAANSATLASWFLHPVLDSSVRRIITFGLNILQDQRIRLFNGSIMTGNVSGTIMAKRRVVP